MLRRVLVSVVAAFGLLGAWQWLTWPDVSKLVKSDPATSAFIAHHQRESGGRAVQAWTPYPAISTHLKHAVLVAEDIGFFGHRGFAVEEMRIALRETLEEGRKLRGASTITQQLAKNLWLSGSRSPWRKLKELLLTRQLEQELSKRRILELYLNLAQFGPDVFGAEAASRTFYGIPAARLDRRQAAELAAGLSRPGSWNPASESSGYKKRVELIRARMRDSHWVLGQL